MKTSTPRLTLRTRSSCARAALWSGALCSWLACDVDHERIGALLDSGAPIGNDGAGPSFVGDGSSQPPVLFVEGNASGGEHSLCRGECIAVEADPGSGQAELTWSDATLFGPGPHEFCPESSTSLTATLREPAAGSEFQGSVQSAAIRVVVIDCNDAGHASPGADGGPDGGVNDAGGPGDAADDCVTVDVGEGVRCGDAIFLDARDLGFLKPGAPYYVTHNYKVYGRGVVRLSLVGGTRDACTQASVVAEKPHDFPVPVDVPQSIAACFVAEERQQVVIGVEQTPLPIFGTGSYYGGNELFVCPGCPADLAAP